MSFDAIRLRGRIGTGAGSLTYRHISMIVSTADATMADMAATLVLPTALTFHLLGY